MVTYEVGLLADPEDICEQLSGMENGSSGVGTEWAMVLESIREAVGEDAREVYTALCKLAGIDGAVMASPAELQACAGTGGGAPLSVLIDALEDGEWITVQDGERVLCATITNYSRLRENGMPWESWRAHDEEGMRL